MKNDIKNITLISVSIFITLLIAAAFGSRTVYARELNEEEKAALEQTIEEAFDKMERENLGKLIVDLSKHKLTVESMYEYVSILRVMDKVRLRRIPIYKFGSHEFEAVYFYTPTKPFSYIDPGDIYDPYYDTDELKKKYDKATIMKTEISYDAHYVNEDNTLKKDLFEHDLKAVPEVYNKILSKVNDNMSDLEKVLIIHDEFCALTSYPDQIGEDEYGHPKHDPFATSPISALTTNASVCYAQSVMICDLLEDAGVKCIRVGSTEMSHAWNMVEIDGKYYHIDTTWDNSDFVSGDTDISHIYFLRTDKEIEELGHKHDWVDESSGSKFIDAPLSATEPGFNGYIFRASSEPEDYFALDAYRSINYLDGRWYCLDSKTNEITSYSDLEGHDKKAVKPVGDDHILMLYASDKALYFCTSYKLYEYRPDTDSLTQVLSSDEVENASFFTSMVVALDEIRVRVCSDADYKTTSKTYQVAELETKPTDTPTPTPTNTPEPTKVPEATKEAASKDSAGSDNKTILIIAAAAAVIVITVIGVIVRKKRR